MILEAVEFQIIIAVFITSYISSILGMAGGIILMAVFSSILPIKLAMLLHGLTQLSSNGFRAKIHKKNIQWQILPAYITGAIVIFILFKMFEFVPSRNTVFVLLGGFSLLSIIPSLGHSLNILKKGRALMSGVLVTLALLLAGASGGVLDVFYVNSKLNRYQVIATKAFTQFLGHTTKLIYYLSIISISEELLHLPLYVYPGVVITAYIGTNLGKLVLDKLNDRYFANISRVLIFSIALSLIVKGFAF